MNMSRDRLNACADVSLFTVYMYNTLVSSLWLATPKEVAVFSGGAGGGLVLAAIIFIDNRIFHR